MESYTVGWIAALSEERAAAEAMLEEEHNKPHDFTKAPNDTNAYSWGRIGQHNIVIASLPEGVYGNNSAATTAAYMLASFPNIRIGLMVGIGAGVPGPGRDVRLGDVAVSMPEGVTGGVIQYDLGKDLADGSFERKGYLNAPPTALLSALGKIRGNHKRKGHRIQDLLAEMIEKNPIMGESYDGEFAYTSPGEDVDRLFEESYVHPSSNPDCSACDKCNEVKRSRRNAARLPAIHYGTIASGNKVVKSAVKRRAVSADAGQACVCIEMEAAGLMNSFPCLVIRGICDYADSHKNDAWHNYAAATAAAYARELLEVIDAADVAKTPKAAETVKAAPPEPQPSSPPAAATATASNDRGARDDELEKLRKRVGELEKSNSNGKKETSPGPHIECGRAEISRRPDGSGTRIYFKKPFTRRPVVSMTYHMDQSNYFYNQRAYLLKNASLPASTPEYFVAGCWTDNYEQASGMKFEIDWVAVEPDE
ncbi:pfs domain-containing protein [Diplodia corticola]|uniref:Pfs domain-containing protein n=1 Tax=Diplodia corticola TaxID=236234 RepID=A0A1J9RKL5_9PEZI|nr:pfs domain-containing protein [Diplodia corticola]OJD33131.1 pfs domain-containing protein [Diplodia corticola]